MTRTGGDRLVRLTDGKEYIIQGNWTFGLVQMGCKEQAIQMTLADAIDIIKKINAYGKKIYAELV